MSIIMLTIAMNLFFHQAPQVEEESGAEGEEENGDSQEPLKIIL